MHGWGAGTGLAFTIWTRVVLSLGLYTWHVGGGGNEYAQHPYIVMEIVHQGEFELLGYC